MKKLFLAFVLVMSAAVTQAQLYKYSNEFLSLGVGARSHGMGGAVISSVNDATSGYWNPAGLLDIKDNIQLALMHNEQFAGIAKHDYGAASFRLNEESVIGLSIIRYGIDDIPNTLNLFQNGQIDYSRITNFSAVDYAFIGSYSRKLKKIEGLKVGGNVKIVRRVVGEFANAWGFGFDLGSKYTFKKWDVAAVLRDVTTTFNAWQYTFSEQDKQVLVSTGNALPSNNLELTAPRLILGGSRKFLFFKEKLSVRPELNADLTFDGKRNTVIKSDFASIDPRLGVEAGYKDLVYLRGGISNVQEIKDINGKTSYTMLPSIGVGIQLKSLSIDYALADVGSGSGTLPFSNIVSLRLNINRKN
ncbi:MAG: PorV/PorQ family protein [Bacteroidota bacterium]